MTRRALAVPWTCATVTALHLFALVAAATATLFVIFCPWVVLMSRRLP